MRKRALYEIEEDTPLEFNKYTAPKRVIGSNGQEIQVLHASTYFKRFYPGQNERTIGLVYHRNEGDYHSIIAEQDYVSKKFPDNLTNEAELTSNKGQFNKKVEVSSASSMKFNFDINKLGSTIDINSLAKNNTNEFVSNLQKSQNKQDTENLVENFCRYLGLEMQKGFEEELKYKEAVNLAQKKLIDLQNKKLESVTQKNERLEKELKILQKQVEGERSVKNSFQNKLVQYESNKSNSSQKFNNNYL